jgi:four helix bundle protein
MLKQQPEDIRERTYRFGCEVVRFCRLFSATSSTNRQIGHQLLRAGTSIGANLEEAQAAYSRREFIAKSAIALKEARETLYWLRIITSCLLAPPEETTTLLREADEIVAILTTIVRHARQSAPLQFFVASAWLHSSYLVSEDGETIVLGGSRTPTVLACSRLSARQLASPAIAGGRLFIRADDVLYAIGK